MCVRKMRHVTAFCSFDTDADIRAYIHYGYVKATHRFAYWTVLLGMNLSVDDMMTSDYHTNISTIDNYNYNNNNNTTHPLASKANQTNAQIANMLPNTITALRLKCNSLFARSVLFNNYLFDFCCFCCCFNSCSCYENSFCFELYIAPFAYFYVDNIQF